MKYSHRFRVRASVREVAEFHTYGSVLKAITPPPIVMRVHAAPEQLGEGDEMDFTMWMGPLPIRWLARIEQVTEASFVDRQVRGPFGSLVHTHSFVDVGGGVTEVRDDIEATLGNGFYPRLMSLAMWVGLPVLFAFRGWKTRRLLERDQG